MAASHTPGPWVVTTSDEGNREGYVEIQQDGQVHDDPDDICRVHRRGPAGGAHDDGLDGPDARLIASAPTMFDAIDGALVAIAGMHNIDRMSTYDRDRLRAAVAFLESARRDASPAKATGQGGGA